MSGIILLQQRSAVTCACDGASYTADGILRSVVQKAFALPTLNMVVASTGVGGLSAVFGNRLSAMFRSFDDAIANLETCMPDLVEDHFDEHIEGAAFTNFTLYFAGMSETRGPEIYSVFFCEPADRAHWESLATEPGQASPLKLRRIEGLFLNPPLELSDLRAAGVPCHGTESEVLARFGDVDLLHIMEIMRRQQGPLRPGMPSKFWVGGHCLITTVDGEGIRQRVVHRWSDRVGEPIQPDPIDWAAWRGAQTAPIAKPAAPRLASNIAPLSRQQRRAMERAQRTA